MRTTTAISIFCCSFLLGDYGVAVPLDDNSPRFLNFSVVGKAAGNENALKVSTAVAVRPSHRFIVSAERAGKDESAKDKYAIDYQWALSQRSSFSLRANSINSRTAETKNGFEFGFEFGFGFGFGFGFSHKFTVYGYQSIAHIGYRNAASTNTLTE